MKNNIVFLSVQIGVVCIFLIVIYHIFFTTALLSAGDFPYFSQLALHNYPYIPSAWDNRGNNGFGVFYPPLSWPSLLFGFPTAILINLFHFSWNAIGRVIYFYPFVILGGISIFILAKKTSSRNLFLPLSIILYLCNTYILLLIGGGQLLYIVGYALTPLVVWSYIRLARYGNRKSDILLTGFLTGIILMVDPRIFYMVFVVVLLYWVYRLLINAFSWIALMKNVIETVVIPLFIAALMNCFWILPTLFTKNTPVQSTIQSYVPQSDLHFFSFATFENAFGLLHPNWPENIFGKVGFMKPEFMILPILAFSALFFIKSKINLPAEEKDSKLSIELSNNVTIIFFALLGLIGVFLAKGTNDPFGFVYLFLFQHLPGFVMFRDPTKWYLYIALSYAVLIPYVLQQFSDHLQQWNVTKKLFGIRYLLAILFVIFFSFLIKESLFRKLGGMYRSASVPNEYQQLETYLSHDQTFSRVLWLPSQARFGYSSPMHPAVNAQTLLKDNSIETVASRLQNKYTDRSLQESAISYIVVPDDTQKEIFMKGRHYDPALYKKTIAIVSHLPWISSIQYIGHIAVFQVKQPKDHIWIEDTAVAVHYVQKNPVSYTIFVGNARKGDRLIFSENYDPHWIAQESGIKNKESSIKNEIYNGRFNSFVLPKDGSYKLALSYTPQRFVVIGLWISSISLIGIIGLLAFNRLRSS